MSEFEPYIRAWRERWTEQRQADAEAARSARVLAERLARRLRAEFGARRVVLLGSLARGEFRIGSDIDLAAEGIPSGDLFRAGACLEAAAGGLHVDLVPIESADPVYLAEVAKDGIVLYDERSR